MNQREKVLAGVLGAVILLGVGGIGGYVGFYAPIQARYRNAAAIAAEVAEKEARLAAIRKEMPRLADAKARSLPADEEAARQEYEAALGRLLADAKVPKGYTLRPKTPDSRAIPELGAKKPAYTRIGVEISLKKVDLATLTDFLDRYYRLNLLHQITRLQIKKPEAEAGGGAKPRSGTADRPDLDVTLVSEAIILDGAESRKSLLPVPVAAAAVLGGAGYQHLRATPEAARGLTPLQLAAVLAVPARDYFAVLAKDVFHGPLPPPPPPKKETPPPPKEEPPPPPKEDIAGFIKLTGITRRSDGTATADVKDVVNNFDYQIDLKEKAGKLSVAVAKFYYIRDKRKSYESGGDLEIGDEASATARKFRVLGLDADGLVLAAKDGPAKDDGGKKGFGGFGRRPAPPPPAPITAVVGGVGISAAAPVPDKIYVWRVGQTLKSLAPLSAGDGQKMAERAAAGLRAGTTPISVPVTPSPRVVAGDAQIAED